MSRWRQLNEVVTVEIVTFLYFMAFGISLVGFPQAIYLKLCHQQGHNMTDCANPLWVEEHPSLQSEASYWIIYTNIAILPPLLVCLTAVSGYSDRHGLMLPLLLPLIGILLAAGWTILQMVYLELDSSLLLISSVVSGMTGYYPGLAMAAQTYNIRDPDVINIKLKLSVFEGMCVMAVAIGSLVVGPILDISPVNGIIYSNILCAALALLAIADVLFRLKTIPDPPATATVTGRCASLRRCFNVDSFAGYFRAVFKKRDKSKRLHLHLVVFSTMIGFMGTVGMTDVVFLYLTKEYGVTNTNYSIYQGVNNLVTLLGNTVFAHLLTTCYHLSDIGFTVLGAITTAISYLLIAYANYPAPYWLAVVFRLFLSYTVIGGRLYVSHTMEENEQAAGMGYYATMQCVVNLVASITFNSVYPTTLPVWPGLSFAFAAFLLIASVPALTYVKWKDLRLGGNNY